MDLTPNPAAAAAEGTPPAGTRRDFLTACKAWQADLASSLKILACESNQARDQEIFGFKTGEYILQNYMGDGRLGGKSRRKL